LTWIHDRIYAAGGEYLPNNWASFVDQTGIVAVLHQKPISPANFIGPTPASFLWMNLEEEVEVGHDERQLAAIFIDENLRFGKSVLIHSSLRLHRIRWTYMAYLIWSGKSVRASLKVVEQKPWLTPYHTDMQGWEDFKEFIAAGRREKSLQSK
jgi:hypothetical protein